MRRTVKVWLAAVMSGVLLAGGAGMTGQAPWGMEAQAHSGRTDASGGHRDNKNASGLGSYHYHCGGHPAHLHPNGVCPYAGGGESAQTQAGNQIQAKPQAQTPVRDAVQASSGAGEGAGTWGWCRNGAQWNYICEDGTRLAGCWKQIDGVWYSFDGDGNMRTGWYGEDGSLYYLGTDGKMAVGTCVIDGTEYQFDEDGKMISPDN